MAIHIKNRWHDEAVERSPMEIAGALAFTTWRIAKDRAISLHGARFVYDTDQQRMAVIAEYLYFQVHIIDRLASQMFADTTRQTLIVELVLKLAESMQDNGIDLFGVGDYGRPFIAGVNQRSGEYGEFSFTDDGPSYPALRHLGYHIQQVMGEQEENRWVIDQVMDIDGGEVYQQIARTLRGLSS